MRIIQIATAQPVGQAAETAQKPLLFGLDEEGLVYGYNWLDRQWVSLSDKGEDEDDDSRWTYD